MIDDIRDLSTVEREKLLARRRLTAYTLKCILGVLVSTVVMTLFAIYMISDFNGAFTQARAAATTGRTITTFMFMLILMFGLYGFNPKNPKAVRDFWLTLIVFVVNFILVVTLSIKTENRYAMPIALISLVLLQVLNLRSSVLSTAILSILIIISYLFSNKAEDYNMARVVAAVIVNTLSPMIINFFYKRHYSRLKFLALALVVPLAVQPLVLMVTIASTNVVTINILWNILWCYGANAISALVFMPAVALFEGVFNIADDFRLSELCNLSNPLLKRLASEAPGTFNHSLVVGTVAEACASAIGENPNMARCAAYYHDIGKLKAPLYFSENQSTYNPHDELIPEVSVSMITSHTLFGEILAKQNRLPAEIVDICRQHHGTAPVGYFYRKALTLKEDGDLALDKYKYAGPKPQTKIAAIIMIADTVEAAIRSFMPDTREEYEARIDMLIDEKIKLKQFDECPITLGDIAIIKKTVIDSLASIHHSRIDYDKHRRARQSR